MPRRPLEAVLEHLRLRAAPEQGQLATDADLLARFVASRDQHAFAELLQRHGSMVLGVARTVLGDAHEAEDVYQAAFLVLSRNAPLIRQRDSVGSWLYGVTLRVAMKARRRNLARRQREEAAGAVSQRDEGTMKVERDEIRQTLVQEIERLPQKYREPIVLCYIEGRTHEDAAQHLRQPVGTIKWRLGQARDRLRERLENKKLAAAAPVIAAVMAQTELRAAVAPALEKNTLQAALGQGTVSPAASALAESTLRDLLQARLLKRVALGSVAACLFTGVGLIGWQAFADSEPVENKQEEPVTKGRERPAPRGTWKATGAETARFNSAGDIASVALAPNGKFVAAVGSNGVGLWDIAGGTKLKELKPRGTFAAVNRSYAVTVSPDSRVVAIAGLNPFVVGGASTNGLTLLDVASGTPQLLPGADGVSALCFTSDSKQLLTCAGNQLCLWDVATRKQAARFEWSPPASSGPGVVTNVAIRADGKMVMAATTSGLYRWDVATRVQEPVLDLSGAAYLSRVTAFSADGRYFAWAAAGQIQVADLTENKKIASVTADRVHRLALANDGRQLAYVALTSKLDPGTRQLVKGKDDDVVRVLSLPAGAEIARCLGHEGYVYGLAFAADGNLLASGSADRSVRLWNLEPVPAE